MASDPDDTIYSHHPDCMMPDGAEPCLGYRELLTERNGWADRCQASEAALDVARARLEAAEKKAVKAALGKLPNPTLSWDDEGNEAYVDGRRDAAKDVQRALAAYDAATGTKEKP